MLTCGLPVGAGRGGFIKKNERSNTIEEEY
jgi:hypothetical protein